MFRRKGFRLTAEALSVSAHHLKTLTIQDVAFGGKGVARAEGKAVFVPFTIEGENVTAAITREKRKFAEARLVSVENPSPHRVEPPCPYFGTCGGCAYQHIDYAHQLEIKSRQVAQALQRIGKLGDFADSTNPHSAIPNPQFPMLPAPQPYGYRNRIRVHAADGVIGFYRHDRHELVDIERCLIASDEVNHALAGLRRKGVRDGDYALSEDTGGMFFSQTNNAVAAELLALVARLATGDQALLVDAYCGAGFFAHSYAEAFEQVIGIEENEHAIQQARRAASPNERYLLGDVAHHLGDALAIGDSARTTLILDPPATGLPARVCDLVLGGCPREIIYVSCHPATLARDLAILCRSYRLESVTPLDMFPQTAEIETVALLRRS